jgi:two-component system, OmpR family, phosphate regulon response regulator OmpR
MKRKPVLSDNAPHILVVDDDDRIRTLLSRFLIENGYRVSTAEHAIEARARLEGMVFDLLVLDVMMPGESGLDLARFVRESSRVPILILTAKAEIDDRLEGLAIGADDYLAKPFDPRELLLRISSILRRVAAPPPNARENEVEQVNFGPFTYHLLRGELRSNDEAIKITERERDILRVLAQARGETLPREALSEQGHAIHERTIDVQINRLRRKIEDDPTNPIYLQTVRGIGYRLVIDR